MSENDILEELLNTYSTAGGAKAPADAEETAEQAPAEQEIAEADAPCPAEEETVPAEQETVPADSAEEETEDTQEAEEDDEDMKVVPDEAPQEKPSRPTEFPTQMFSIGGEEAPTEQPEEPQAMQMTMDDFAGEEPTEETEEEEDAAPSWEEQLEETRKEQIRDFQVRRNREDTDFKYEGSEAPDELPIVDVSAELSEDTEAKYTPFEGDYTDHEQKKDVERELQFRYRSFRFRILMSTVPLLLLLWSEYTVLTYGSPTIIPALFLLLHLGLLTALGLLMWPMLRDGLTAIRRRKATVDTAPAIVFVATWIHTALLWFRLDAVESGEASMLTAAAAVLLFLCALGRMCKNSRILRNFAFVSNEGEKQAAALIEDERTAVEIGRRAVVTGVPRVAFFRSVKFLDNFMANSYIRDRYDEVLGRYIPCAVVLSALVGVLSMVIAGDVWNLFYTFTATLCITLPAAPLALSLPLYRECKRQLAAGNMMCGYAAAERFGDLHGVALDISDMYLDDSIALHGIRPFGAARIDEVITDAAAVAIRSDGPLCGLFLRIIEGKTEILPPVENLVFEQDMGFSGWVGGRRVLVGNRKLLENHGIHTPSADYERKYKKDGRELVYLSVAGELSAMFVISYMTDPAISDALHSMENAGVSLLIRSRDPNITEDSICAGFGLSDYYVDLLTASAGRLYDRLRHNKEEKASAGAAVGGTVEHVATLLCGCKRLRRRGIISMVMQIACGAIGAIIAIATAVAGGLLSVGVLLTLILVTAALTAVGGLF